MPEDYEDDIYDDPEEEPEGREETDGDEEEDRLLKELEVDENGHIRRGKEEEDDIVFVEDE